MNLNKQEIREKLNKKYNPELWRELISEIFPEKDFFSIPLNKILTDTESKNAKSIKQFGQIKLDDNRNIALFEVELKTNKNIDKNRVELRGLISKELLSGIKDGALVIYYSEDKPQYRFTFIAKQTKITEIGDFEEYETNAKRFTYVLGETESCNTPADRFLKLSEIKNKKLSDIEEAFSVEKVSKEFFTKYKEHFEKFNKFSYDNFKSLLPFSHYVEEQKEKAIRDFNKKLLGRIVFIYFLQKKGWIGIPVENDTWTGGSTKFLSDNFNTYYKNSSNLFYFDFLEPLFYDTLNKKRKDNLFKPYNTDTLKYTFTQIPFLNGGLFEEELMEKRSILFYPNELFKDLFEYFDQYNFTIIEDSLEEKEIAIDPEMLGHIFENLLEDNKDKGAFYTPKEIVKYMCQDALINYLDTRINTKNIPLIKDKPKQESIFDNSDIQQMSLTKEEYKENIPKDVISDFIKYGKKEDDKNLIRKHAKKIEYLLDDVKILDPAIGSGAFPMGMLNEIFNAKLHLDWTLDKAETKRKIIENSIYGVDIEKGAVDIAMLRFWLSLVVDEEEPSPLPNLDYKIMIGNSLTGDNVDSGNMFHKHFLDEIQKLRHEFYNADEPEDKKKLKKQIEDETNNMAKSLNINLEDGFNFKLEFSEVFDKKGGFDIVIANPPYVFARDSKEKGILEIDKEVFYKKYKLAKYQINLYSLFIEMSYSKLKENGIFCFIVPNNWMTINTNKDLRKFILEKSDITIVNFYAKVFENASVDSSIILFEKSEKNKTIKLFEYENSFKLIKEKNCKYFLDQKDHIINIEIFKNSSYSDLIDSIEKDKLLLKDISDVKSGLKAYELGKGKPEQTKEMKEKRIYHSSIKIDDTYIKYLDGKDVCRYYLKWSGEYLKYGKNLAAQRGDFDLFSTPRILVRQIPSKPPYSINACFVEDTILNDLNSMNIINIKFYPKFVLAILNSSLMTFWFIHKFGKLQRGIFPQFKINELEIFPIVDISKEQQIPFIEIVDKIIEDKKKGIDTTDLEKQIDIMVYKLYDLTDDEIRVIELH